MLSLIWLVILVTIVIASRLFLKEVGRKALAKVSSTAKLVPTSSPNWQNRALIDGQTSPLKFRGFEDVESYQVASMPGVLLKILFHQATNVAAHVYEHPKAGTWTEMATRYTDEQRNGSQRGGLNSPDHRILPRTENEHCSTFVLGVKANGTHFQ